VFQRFLLFGRVPGFSPNICSRDSSLLKKQWVKWIIANDPLRSKKNVPCNYLAEKKTITYFLQLQRAFGLRNLETIPSSLLSDFFLSKSTFCGGGRTKTEVAG